MSDLIAFIYEHRVFAVLLFVLDLVLAVLSAAKLYLIFNRHLIEGMGGRNKKNGGYRKYLYAVREYVEGYGNRVKNEGIFVRIFTKSQLEMKQCGIHNNFAVFAYMFLKYVFPVMTFIIAFILNFPDFIRAAAAAFLMYALVGYSVRYMRKSLENEFKRSAYKIYRYLHNQISSGVSVTDAIKTVYKVVDDSKLQDNLLLLAARYARTLDIDASLDEFRSRYKLQEVESLCVALKQGIATGDNKDILERQEKLMFNQYFNYIQAETDACKRKRTLIVAMYALIIIILIAIPLINDAGDAVSKIFIG